MSELRPCVCAVWVGVLAASACNTSGMNMQATSDAPPGDPAVNTCTLDGPVTVQGSVTVTNPVQVTGTVAVTQPVRTVSADSDPTRHVQANTGGGDSVQLIAGPFFLTDATLPAGSFLYESTEGCPFLAAGSGVIVEFDNTVSGVASGMRFFIPEGRWLCSFSHNSVSVAGFRPY